jgi:predicted phosphodiesterase
MKAQLMSDLHTEFYYGRSMEMLQRLEFEPDLDFLFLLGDIVVPSVQTAQECREVFAFLGSKARYVLYTVGNHEYYHSSKGTNVEAMLRSYMPDNFVWLDNNDVTLDGVHFYGGAMWFPDHPLNQLYEKDISDFELIRDIHDWVYKSNTEFRANGMRLITDRTLVLTHHLPSHLSTPKMYAESTINRFFVSDESKLIMAKQPRLWVHGHTHHACQYELDGTLVMCHPFGYPGERGCRTPRIVTRDSVQDFFNRLSTTPFNYPLVVFELGN